MENENVWEAPEVVDLGKAEELIKDANTVGGGDSQFSVLEAS